MLAGYGAPLALEEAVGVWMRRNEVLKGNSSPGGG